MDGSVKGVDISEKGREPTKMGREGKRVLTRVNESLVRLCKTAVYVQYAYVRAGRMLPRRKIVAEERSLGIDRCEYFPDGLLFED